MKPILKIVTCILMTGIIMFISCRKTKLPSTVATTNKPPIANAGPAQLFTLPTDSVSLDGSLSSNLDGKISEWLWTTNSGPASFTITNSSTVKTVDKNLAADIYQFELKVPHNTAVC